MNVVIGLMLIGTYWYICKYKGSNKMPWWVHITLLLAASSVLANSVVGPGLVGLVETGVGFLAGMISGVLEMFANQPVAISASILAAAIGAIFLIVLILDVRDKVANKPALVAAVLIPLLAMSATGFLGTQGQEMTSQISGVAENAGRAVVGG